MSSPPLLKQPSNEEGKKHLPYRLVAILENGSNSAVMRRYQTWVFFISNIVLYINLYIMICICYKASIYIVNI